MSNTGERLVKKIKTHKGSPIRVEALLGEVCNTNAICCAAIEVHKAARPNNNWSFKLSLCLGYRVESAQLIHYRTQMLMLLFDRQHNRLCLILCFPGK